MLAELYPGDGAWSSEPPCGNYDRRQPAPRDPEETIKVRATAFRWVVDLVHDDKVVRGKLLQELDDIPTLDPKLLGEMVK
jgi:hypothetical protein